MSQYRQSIDGIAIDIRQDPEYMHGKDSVRENHDMAHFYCGRDAQGRLWLNGKQHAPTRDELIEGWMAYPICTPTKDSRGWSVMGEKHWPTLEEATDKVDRLYPDLIPAAPPPEKDQ